jgi:uncharacterized protein GlcG (DUF336 family)
MIRMSSSLSATFASLAFMVPAAAQELPTAKTFPLALANQLALKAVEKCTADGFRVSVVVADRNGVPIVTLRGDGTGPHTVDSATRKAYTAASMRTTTQELGERLAANPGAAALATLPNIVTLGGGIPVKAGEEVIGSAGAGGAPGGDKDAACVQAGIDAIAEGLK